MLYYEIFGILIKGSVNKWMLQDNQSITRIERQVCLITVKQKIESACAMAGITVTELGAGMGMSQQNGTEIK